jgi:hypothetical protein
VRHFYEDNIRARSKEWTAAELITRHAYEIRVTLRIDALSILRSASPPTQRKIDMTRNSLLAAGSLTLALSALSGPVFALNPQPLPPKRAHVVQPARVSTVTSRGSAVMLNPQPLPPRQSGLRTVVGR